MVSRKINIFVWPIGGTLKGITSPGQSGPESNGNEEVVHIPQIFKAGASPSDRV